MAQESPVLPVAQPVVLDILDTSRAPALSSTDDTPVIETKPDAQNQGRPPDLTQAVPSAQAEEAELTEESATEESTDEQSGPPKGVPKGVGKRLAELTKRADEEHARAVAAEERLDRFLKSLEQGLGQAPVPEAKPAETESEPVKPNRYDYADPEAWEAAVMDYSAKISEWNTKRALSQFQETQRKEAELRAIQEGQRKAHEAYVERVAKAKEKYADFKEVAERPDIVVSQPLAVLIHQSELAPDIQYYLGSHPDEAKRIYELPVPLQIKELGKIEAKLTEPPPPPKPIPSAAPKPIKPLSGTNAGNSKSPFEMNMDEYAAFRREQMRQEGSRRH